MAKPQSGLLVLDEENPERIFYRSDAAETETTETVWKEIAYI